MKPAVTICVLTYGDHPGLARRSLGSIFRHIPPSTFSLLVGANAVGPRTERYLRDLKARQQLNGLIISKTNLHKCPMMRRLLARVKTEWVWWFDDDAFLRDPEVAARWLHAANTAPPEVAMLGAEAVCEDARTFFRKGEDPVQFTRSAKWYNRLPPPSWRPGGKGEFNFEGRNLGDGRWHFITGFCWLARVRVLRQLDWPDPRLLRVGDDVLLGEALRQHDYRWLNLGLDGLGGHRHPRRGDPDL